MTISVTCQCGKILEAEDRHAGRSGRCSNCGARLLLPHPVKPPRDPEVAFEEYKPTVADGDDAYTLAAPASSAAEEPVEEEFLEQLPPIIRKPTAARKADSTPSLEPAAYRRHFFAVWWCHWVLRIVGLIIVGCCAAVLVVTVLGAIVLVFRSADGESAALTFAGVGSFLMLAAPGFLLALTVGFCLLAAAELLTAASWNYLRKGIGGMGPLEP